MLQSSRLLRPLSSLPASHRLVSPTVQVPQQTPHFLQLHVHVKSSHPTSRAPVSPLSLRTPLSWALGWAILLRLAPCSSWDEDEDDPESAIVLHRAGKGSDCVEDDENGFWCLFFYMFSLLNREKRERGPLSERLIIKMGSLLALYWGFLYSL